MGGDQQTTKDYCRCLAFRHDILHGDDWPDISIVGKIGVSMMNESSHNQMLLLG